MTPAQFQERPTNWRTAEQKLAEVAGMIAAWRTEARHNLSALGCPECRGNLERCALELEFLLNGMEVVENQK